MKSFMATTAIVLLMGGSSYAAPAQFNTYQAQASDIDASKFIGLDIIFREIQKLVLGRARTDEELRDRALQFGELLLISQLQLFRDSGCELRDVRIDRVQSCID